MGDYYDSYCAGASLGEIIDHICRVFGNFQARGALVTSRWLEDYENVKDHIVMRLVNYGKNEALLQDCPYIRKMDLALTFRVCVSYEAGGRGSCLVTDSFMKAWGVDKSQLYERAVINMNRIWTPVLEPLENFVYSLTEGTCVREEGETPFPGWRGQGLHVNRGIDGSILMSRYSPQPELYILSTDEKIEGAAVLFYTDLIRRFAREKECDVILLPSSIHEFLVLEDSGLRSSSSLRCVVRQVNKDQVEDEEVLSDHVYRYIREEDKIVIDA